MYSFDEHDEDDQAILWDRAQAIAQDNADGLLDENEMLEDEFEDEY